LLNIFLFAKACAMTLCFCSLTGSSAWLFKVLRVRETLLCHSLTYAILLLLLLHVFDKAVTDMTDNLNIILQSYFQLLYAKGLGSCYSVVLKSTFDTSHAGNVYYFKHLPQYLSSRHSDISDS
jgi:hypothetical protein